MGAPFSGTSFLVLSVAVVGILATSLLLLAYYLVLTKCRLASHHDVATQLNTSATVYSASAAPRRGLEDAAIRRIPTFRYRRPAPVAVASECAVCLSEFQDGERLRLLPPCLHAFHIDCIDAWLHATAKCPLCRAVVSGSPHIMNHIDIDQADATADAIVVDIASPSPGGMGRRDDGELLMGVQQPVRRSLSMDSCNDKNPAVLGEGAGRLPRSFFSFSQGRSSRSAILPI